LRYALSTSKDASFYSTAKTISHCADREESGGYSKRAVNKIEHFNLKESSYYIAGTGRSSIIANAIPHIVIALHDAEQHGEDLLEKHRAIIGNSLRLLYEELIWRMIDLSILSLQLSLEL
jgi:hypothetical protein